MFDGASSLELIKNDTGNNTRRKKGDIGPLISISIGPLRELRLYFQRYYLFSV